MDEKLYENISFYDISCKPSTGPKPLHIRLHKIDQFIRFCCDEFKHLVLFANRLLDKICDEIKYLISEKSSITDSINHNFGEIRIDSYNSLPIEKVLTFHNAVILIKSVVNKNKNYYYNIFLEKCSFNEKSYTKYF